MKIQRINDWFEKQAKWIIRFRWLIIFLFTGLLVFSFNGLKKITIESSFDEYFLEDDPILVKSDEFKEIFGNDYFVAVLTECDNTFSHKSLKLIKELSQELLDSISYSDKITSLTNIEFLRGTQEGMQIEQIVPEEIPTDKTKLEEIRKKAYSKPNIAKRLVSKDGRLSWILLKLRTFPEDSIWKKDKKALAPDFLTGKQASKIISKAKYKEINPKATGMPYLAFKKQSFYSKEAKKIMLMAFFFSLFVLIFATKSFRGVVVPLITSVSSIVIIYGMLGYAGYKIDSAMMSIPILLSMAIAIAYNIHLFSYFKRHFHKSGKRKEAVIESVAEMGWPILFSALTTVGALLTFLVIPVKPLQFMGFATSSCVLITFLIVIFLMPSVLSIGGDRKSEQKVDKKEGLKEKRDRWLDRQLSTLGRFVLRNPKSIIVTSIIIAVFMIAGALRVESAFDIEKTMGRQIQYIDDILDISESELGSLYSYDVMVEFPKNGDAKNPENLLKLEEYSKYAESLELTKRTTSILDIVKDLNKTLNENSEKYYTIPKDKNQVAQMLLLYENSGGTESEYWMDYDYKRLRLMVELNYFNSGEAKEELAKMQSEAKKIFPNAQVTVVGNLPQFTSMMDYVVRGQVASFGIALIVIMLLLMLVFGSFKVGLVGIIPNIAPSIVVGGIMGWLDIPLDMMTATIMPMILGLAVDDTIHFINHGKLEFSRKGNYRDSILKTFKTVGVALVLSTVVIASNFLMYTTSLANQFINLGILAVAGMLSALLADLFITPILFKWCKIFGKEQN
ncbi:MAG: MMPL family transporter [Marinifilaceae bacterium]|jgi:predicted RND superfamily exporter protein|nr:MMPL family transporter [Marinifilaceae bacterium]